jgi:hypothetical protein
MRIKILFVDTYYSRFLGSFRKNNPECFTYSYQEYRDKLLNTFFGTSDFYSYNLRKLGHEVEDLIINDEILQKKWAKENGIKIKDNWLTTNLQRLPMVHKVLGKPQWIQQIALEQIKKARPDIVYVQDLGVFVPETLNTIKKHCKLLVGQIASPLPTIENHKCFNLIITSFPHFVEKFRKLGIKSVYQKLAFESRVLQKVGKQKRIYGVSFVGSFTPNHTEGTKILEEVARHIPVHVWGQGLRYLSPLSPLRKNYHGEAWGLDMYRILAQSKIVINRHIGVSGDYANNMRLYEATGMGAMLITDHKKNLNDIFRVGKEVVEYKNSEDLINKINYYLKNEGKREQIAIAGQTRTLKDHNYQIGMKELDRILETALRKNAQSR